jgi:hypothetical protein
LPASALYRVGSTIATVATPTFTPAPGVYTSAQSVTITTTTSGATIRYTTNGNDPTSSSAVASGSISVAATTTLKAKGFLSGANDSAVATAAYTINTGGVTPVDRTDETGATITARASISAGEDYTKAFDNSVDTKWLDNAGVPTSAAPSWIGFEFAGSGYAINRYTITSANDMPDRDPKSWRLKASNATTPDWSTATVLDTQTAQTFADRKMKKTYDFSNSTAYKKYRLEITENGGSTMTQLSEIELLTTGATIATGTISREVWTGVGGTAVSAIPVTTTPNITDTLTSFKAPTDWAEEYGTRVRGYLIAPSDGKYVFWIAGDDNCELWLSTDSTVANKGSAPIARVTSWTSPEVWNTDTPNQKSAEITLVGGQRYYIEALQKEGGGGDSLAVGWAKPGQGTTAPSEVIPGSVLSPYSAGIESGAIYELEPKNAAGKRLHVTSSGIDNGTNVEISTDLNGSNQRWKLEDQGAGIYELTPQHATGQRLDVNGGATVDGTKVQIWVDNNTNPQRWKFELQADGSYEIIPQHDATKRLKVNGGGTTNGTAVQSWVDDNSDAVRWNLLKQ